MKLAALGVRSLLLATAIVAAFACDAAYDSEASGPAPGDAGKVPSEGNDARPIEEAGEPLDGQPGVDCDPDALFDQLAPLEGDVNAASAEHPSLTADELDIFFSSGTRVDASLRNEIFTAHRAKITDAFGPAARLQALSTSGQDAHPAISGDGLFLVYTTQVPGEGRLTLAVTTRQDRSVEFNPPTVPIPNVGGPTSDTRPFLTSDGSALYFTSDRSGTAGPTDLYLAKRSGDGFSSAVPLAAPINSEGAESNAVLTADGLTLYFGRDNQILRAHRATLESTFGEPNAVAELNAGGTSSSPAWISRDQCRLYFQTNRSPKSLWLATRQPSR